MFVNVSGPLPEASIVPPLFVSVNKRFVLVAAPLYLKVPPSSTKLAAAFVDCPILLAVPPFANEDTLKTPPEIVVTPL